MLKGENMIRSRWIAIVGAVVLCIGLVGAVVLCIGLPTTSAKSDPNTKIAVSLFPARGFSTRVLTAIAAGEGPSGFSL